ncbi:MAG: ATP-dependent carboxylate-amine ligase, partial [Acidimicrobiia bacterium]
TEQWAATLLGFWRTFGGRWVNPPDAVMLATDKLGQLRQAAAAGWPVPETLVTNDPDQARSFVGSHPAGVVAKAVRRLTFERDGTRYLAWTRRLRDEDAAVLDAVRAAPCMLQAYVPKRIEVRVTVVGERIFAAELHSQDVAEARDDFRRAIARIPILPHALPGDVAARSRAVVEALGLVSAAIDIAVTPDGEYVFLEVNAPGSWAFVQERTELPISAAVADLLLGHRGT